MNIANVVAAMANAGCSAEQIAQAVDELTPKRSSAAVRQARYRERLKEASQPVTNVTRDVTERNSDASPLAPFSPPDKESSPTPPKEINPPISPQPHISSADEFERWYANFPNKVGKAAARKAWVNARKQTSYEKLCGGLRRYLAKTDDRPWCNPATWLNQGRWDDEPSTVKPFPYQKPLTGMQLVDQQLAMEIENGRNSGKEGGNSQPLPRLSFIG